MPIELIPRPDRLNLDVWIGLELSSERTKAAKTKRARVGVKRRKKLEEERERGSEWTGDDDVMWLVVPVHPHYSLSRPHLLVDICLLIYPVCDSLRGLWTIVALLCSSARQTCVCCVHYSDWMTACDYGVIPHCFSFQLRNSWASFGVEVVTSRVHFSGGTWKK